MSVPNYSDFEVTEHERIFLRHLSLKAFFTVVCFFPVSAGSVRKDGPQGTLLCHFCCCYVSVLLSLTLSIRPLPVSFMNEFAGRTVFWFLDRFNVVCLQQFTGNDLKSIQTFMEFPSRP